jgi:hypothetical protein
VLIDGKMTVVQEIENIVRTDDKITIVKETENKDTQLMIF